MFECKFALDCAFSLDFKLLRNLHIVKKNSEKRNRYENDMVNDAFTQFDILLR